MTGVPPRGPALPPGVAEAREQVVELLSQRYAQDAMTMEELDRRLTLAYQAESAAELTALVADLPGGSAVTANRPPDVDVVAAARAERVLAFMGNTRRGGFWRLPPKLDTVAVMAELRLDLREVEFSSPYSVINLRAVMCSTLILVPRGVNVINRVSAIMADVSDRSQVTQDPNAPVIVLEGWAVMAEVKIRTADYY